MKLSRIASILQYGLFFLGSLFLLWHLKDDLSEFFLSKLNNISRTDTDDLYRNLAVICFISTAVIWTINTSLLRMRSTRPEQSLPTLLIERYRRSGFARVLKELEPLSIILAAIALLYSVYGIHLARLDSDLRMREAHATFLMQTEEKMRDVRKTNLDFIISDKFVGKDCPMKFDEEWPNTNMSGYLERLATLEVPLNGIDASILPLHRLSLKNIKLKKVNFTFSDLDTADFSAANLKESGFDCANLRDAKFVGRDTNLQDVNFVEAGLYGADFSDADLRRANFSGANLMKTIFSDAILEGAIFSGASIDGANFTGAKYLTKSQISSACIKDRKNRDPKLPIGLPQGWQPKVKRKCPEYRSFF